MSSGMQIWDYAARVVPVCRDYAQGRSIAHAHLARDWATT